MNNEYQTPPIQTHRYVHNIFLSNYPVEIQSTFCADCSLAFFQQQEIN